MTNDLEYYQEIGFSVIAAKAALEDEGHIFSAFTWYNTKEGHDFWGDYFVGGSNFSKKYRAQKRPRTMINEYEALIGDKQ